MKFGYIVDDKGLFAIEETEAKTLLLIFQKFDEGMSLRQLTVWLHENGIRTKRNGIWTAQQLSKMLRDRTYIGEGKYRKRTRRGDRMVKCENPEPVPYLPIIPQDFFERIQLKLVQNKKKNGGGANNFYMLQHLGRCGECGGSLLCQRIRGYRYIYCQRQFTYPHINNCCRPKRWNLDMIENYICNEVEDTLDNYRDASNELWLDRVENANQEQEQQIAEAKRKLEQLKLKKQRVLTIIRKGLATEAEAELQLRAVNSEREYWDQHLANLEALKQNDKAVWDSFCAQRKEIDRMFDYGFYPTPDQKKEILNLLLEEFVLHKDGKIELHFKLPMNEKQVAETVLSLSHNELS